MKFSILCLYYYVINLKLVMLPEVIKEYFRTHTLDEVTADWKHVQSVMGNPFKEWFEFLRGLQAEHDSKAYYIDSTAIRYLLSICNNRGIKYMNDAYTDEIFDEVKKLVIDDIKYEMNRGGKENRAYFSDLYNNKLEYYKLK